MFVFILTYMLYPSIVFQKQKDIFPGKPDWSIFVLNMTMSLSDFLGRTLAKIRIYDSRIFLLIASFLRLLLVASTFTIALTNDSLWNT